MSAFLTKKQLCGRWGISANKLESWIHEGIIKPIKKGEAYFSLAAVEAVEQLGLDPEQVKPLKLARLQRENERLQKENEELRGVLGRMWSIGLPYLCNVLPKDTQAD